MPECPGCDEEFPKGGAYVTHVRHCEHAQEDPTEGNQEQTDEQRIEELEEQVDALQKIIFSIAEQQEKRLNQQGERIEVVENNILSVGEEMIMPLAEKIDEHSQMFGTLRDWMEAKLLSEVKDATGREFDDIDQAIEYVERREQVETIKDALEDTERTSAGEWNGVVDNVEEIVREKPIRTAMVEGDRPIRDTIESTLSDESVTEDK
jgi:hypothetical protein